VIHDGMPYDPIQRQSIIDVTEVRNVRKWSISKAVSSANR